MELTLSAAVNELEACRQEQRAFLDSSLDALITMDADGIIRQWNAAATRILGWQREEVVGRELAEVIVPPQLRAAHRAGLRRYLDGGQETVLGQRIEIEALRADGSEFPVELTIAAHQSAGAPIFVGTVRDISERKRVEAELRDSRALFRRIVSNVPGMVYQFQLRPDGSYDFPFVSDGCRELYGIDRDELKSNPAFVNDIVAPEARADFARLAAASAQNLEPWNWEGRVILPDGTIKWLQVVSRPQLQSDGGILWDGVALDVSARYQAEIERDRFFTLALDMFAILERDGRFQRVNPAFETTLGWSQSALARAPILQWVHPDDRDLTRAALERIQAGEAIRWEQSHSGRRRFLPSFAVDGNAARRADLRGGPRCHRAAKRAGKAARRQRRPRKTRRRAHRRTAPRQRATGTRNRRRTQSRGAIKSGGAALGKRAGKHRRTPLFRSTKNGVSPTSTAPPNA